MKNFIIRATLIYLSWVLCLVGMGGLITIATVLFMLPFATTDKNSMIYMQWHWWGLWLLGPIPVMLLDPTMELSRHIERYAKKYE